MMPDAFPPQQYTNPETQQQSVRPSLPSEISLHIFGYLTPQELLNVGLMSKSWYTVTKDKRLWRLLPNNSNKELIRKADIINELQLAKQGGMLSLNLYGRQIDSKGAEIISKIFRNPNCPPDVQLSSNKIGAEGVKAIVTALLDPNCPVNSLCLANNCMGLEGAKVIAAALLSPNYSLAALDVSNNDIGPEGEKIIADAVVKKGISFDGIDILDPGKLPSSEVEALMLEHDPTKLLWIALSIADDDDPTLVAQKNKLIEIALATKKVNFSKMMTFGRSNRLPSIELATLLINNGLQPEKFLALVLQCSVLGQRQITIQKQLELEPEVRIQKQKQLELEEKIKKQMEKQKQGLVNLALENGVNPNLLLDMVTNNRWELDPIST